MGELAALELDRRVLAELPDWSDIIGHFKAAGRPIRVPPEVVAPFLGEE